MVMSYIRIHALYQIFKWRFQWVIAKNEAATQERTPLDSQTLIARA